MDESGGVKKKINDSKGKKKEEKNNTQELSIAK